LINPKATQLIGKKTFKDEIEKKEDEINITKKKTFEFDSLSNSSLKLNYSGVGLIWLS